MNINIFKISLAILSVLSLTGCYSDYEMDYDYSAAYVAYQYDLRTFVIGEDMKFDFTVALAGVLDNTKDLKVRVEIDNDMLSGSLAGFSSAKNVSEFTALDGLLGNASFGELSQSYVKDEVSAQGLTNITPLPSDYYATTGTDLTIKKGRSTAVMTISATDMILNDAKALKPYFGLGIKIVATDADSVIKEKSFEIIAVKCENRFFGNWYHGGKTIVKDDATGAVISEDDYFLSLPQSDDKVYSLSTIAYNAVATNKLGNKTGSLNLTFNGNQISVASANESKTINEIQGMPSTFNDAKLLQDRKLYLNYSYSNGDGTTSFVTDTLAFRNRIRDGINEWQDENPKKYK